MSPAQHSYPQFLNPILAAQCRQDDVTGAFHYTPLSDEASAYSSDLESRDAEGGGCHVSSGDEEESQGSGVFQTEHQLYSLDHSNGSANCCQTKYLSKEIELAQVHGKYTVKFTK